MPPILYSAEVLDEAADFEGIPLWSCPHAHSSPTSAHQCAVSFLDRVARIAGGDTVIAERAS